MTGDRSKEWAQLPTPDFQTVQTQALTIQVHVHATQTAADDAGGLRIQGVLYHSVRRTNRRGAIMHL